jgi:PAS domain S-box-containing protein
MAIQPRQSAHHYAPPAVPKASVLLVDDTPANLVSLRAILNDPGYELVEASTGEEALEKLTSHEFAVVLFDVRLPRMSGFDVAKYVRADNRSQYTPIIFLNADYLDRVEIEAGYALGAVDFFEKPLSPFALQAKVRGFVALFQQKERAKQEAEQLRLIVQGTKDYAIFMLDPHGNVATWNAGAERIKQYKAEEIIGQHFSKFYSQDVIDRGWPEHELKVAAAEGRFEDEGWRLRKDGSRFWANVVITALRDESGQLLGFSKVTRDLTERKQAEESLRQSEERFRHMVEGVQDYAIFMLDHDGNVATWNAGAERIKQYKADEIVGRHFSTFYPKDVADSGFPAHELKVAAAEGRFEDEGWRVRKDGSQFWANVVITAIKDDQGNLLGFTKVTRDLTARKQAEENARRLAEETAARQVAHQERERLRVTLASIGDAVISTDAEGRVEFLNTVAEDLVGWKSGEAAGRALEDVFRIVNENTRRPVENPALRALRDGKIVGLANHTILIARDGTEHPIDDSAAPIQDASGDVIGSVLVFRDITDRRQTEQTLQSSEARMRAILETALDCVIAMDHDGKVVEFNSAAERTFGYARSEVVGRELSEFIIPPSLRDQYLQGMSRYLTTGEGPVLGHRHELPALRADGTEIPVEVSITSSSAKGSPLFTAYLRDISERKRAEQHRSIRLAVNQVLSQAGDVREGVGNVLRAVSENLGWDVGFVWMPNGDRSALSCLQSWHEPDLLVAEFEQASCSRTFASGEGLPGRVWASSQPAWILDVTADPVAFARAASAAKYGLHSAVASPLVVGEKSLGVIEFFTRRIREPDVELLELLGTVAANVAQFIERGRAEEALQQSEAHLRAVVETTPACIKVVAADGTLVSMNSAGLRMVDAQRSEDVQGACVYNLIRPPYRDAFREFNEAVCRGESGTVEFEIEGLQGTRRFMETHAAPLPGPDGSRQQLAITFDVTDRKRAEAALRESEEKLRLLADTIPQLAWMARPDGHIFWYNRRWYEYTGTTPEQMEGWGWQSVHDPEVLPQVVERWKRSLDTGEPFDMVFPVRGADGVLRPFLTRVNPLKNGDGHILYWFGTNTDITELREARAALADSEERLRLALEAGRMGVWDWNVRTGDLKWSDSLEPLHGLAPGAFGGTFEHFQQLVHPSDRQVVQSAIRQALETGGEFYVEFRNLRENGGIHWIAGSGKVFYGDDGQPLRMIGIGLDVTPRKRSEQTARFLADASAALAVLVDFDSTLQRVASLAVPHFADWVSVDVLEENGSLRRVAVAHVDPAKVQLANDIHRRFPPDPAAPGGVWNILRTGQAEIVPVITDDMLEASIKDGELLRIMRELGLKSYIGVPLSVRGKTLGVLTFIVAESDHVYDETDLAVAKDLASRAAIAVENTQLYRELKEADRRKDEFLATLAHELRNPLAPIRNGLQVLRLAGGGGEMVDEARTMMERQLTHMVRLVDDLLDVSRITRNKLELRKERVSLATLVHSAVETSRPLI